MTTMKKEPQLRFPGFEGEWFFVKISDIFTVTRGTVIAKTSISEIETDFYQYPIYSSQTSNQGVMGYDSTFDFDGNLITWTTDGANAGRVFARTGKFRCTNVCGVLLEKESTIGYANKAVSEILAKEAPRHVSQLGNNKLMNNVMSEVKILIPSLPEQQKIADCLSTLDEVIELESQKLEQLRQYKKGLLQQLFV